jgi:RimJ/RimL family protein N-acetyltransferase
LIKDISTDGKIFPPEEIAGPRVLLKRHVVGLAEKMFGYVDQDRERLREFLPWVDLTRTVTDEAEYIRMTLQQWESHELFDYGLFRKSDGLYLGNCGVHTISWQHRRCELGYWILGAFEGQGYISEAVRALEATFFELGFNRVEIHCSSSNLRSAKVPRAAGYRLEAIQRQDSIENGRFRDTYVFAKLKHERSASAPPTLLGIDHARLCVGDLQASKAWYAKALGAAPALDVP